MNSQLIVPVAVIALIAIIVAIAFLNRKDKRELEKRLRRNQTKKRLQDTDKVESK